MTKRIAKKSTSSIRLVLAGLIVYVSLAACFGQTITEDPCFSAVVIDRGPSRFVTAGDSVDLTAVVQVPECFVTVPDSVGWTINRTDIVALRVTGPMTARVRTFESGEFRVSIGEGEGPEISTSTLLVVLPGS